jgi:hypothetical protein
MITINLKTAADIPQGDELTQSTLMLVARSMADKYKAQTQGKVCKRHPKTPHIITIIHDHETIRIEHSAFCCKGFEKSIRQLIKKKEPKLFE